MSYLEALKEISLKRGCAPEGEIILYDGIMILLTNGGKRIIKPYIDDDLKGISLLADYNTYYEFVVMQQERVRFAFSGAIPRTFIGTIEVGEGYDLKQGCFRINFLS